MKPIIVILSVLAVAGVLLVNYDADGGWLFNRQKCEPGGQCPIEVPFPIDEIPSGGLVVLPTDDPPTSPTLDNPCEALEARVTILERRLDAIANAQPQPQTIDYDTLAAHLPPVRMEIHHPDGTVYTQSKPLGEPIRLRLVPQ